MDGFHRLFSRFGICYFLIAASFMLPNLGFAATVTIDMEVPFDGIAHIADGGFVTPDVISSSLLSTDQNLTNLLDNNPNTFYQPAAGSNPGAIGSDVLLDFDFPPIPDNATIESVTLRVGISSDTTDDPFLRGFFFAAYSRLDLTTYLNVDLGPGIVGGFLVSPQTPVFVFPPLLVVQVPRGTVFEMDLAPEELTLDNVRNLSVSVAGLNEAPLLFDRTTLVNATVVYSVPDPLILSLLPLTATNEVISQPEHTVTATVEREGVPEEGVLTDFRVTSGPNIGQVSDPFSGECVPDDCRTDLNGQVSWTYETNKQIGTDLIEASTFDEVTFQVVESNTVDKVWILPPSNVPTLSQWGLIAMASILGIVALTVMRRRKVVA
ncbi:MAG: hypothetical protein DHS20C13_01080 [Thermodesulfobacteriota bacterium]|nr:MAG: hypothetical protein DHS20C13_01080 [Thermodesulfobacteriota bacterium]